MINTLKRTDIEAVENNLAFQLIPILLDVIMFHHDNNHIHIVDELIKVVELILGNLMVFQEGVIALQRTCKMTLLQLEHLKCR